MPEILRKDKRLSLRETVLEPFSCEMRMIDSHRKGTFDLVNISRSGIGIETVEYLPTGSLVAWVFLHHSLKFEVIWRQHDMDFPNIFSYGLFLIDTDVDLIKVYQASQLR